MNSFRAPELPRHPLAIGVDGGGEKSPFEARVLAKLYELLPGAGGDDPPRDVAAVDRLNLFAYELGVRRGREESRTGGTDDTAIRNAVGFQTTGLIKRLQSSPYAFLRTLARGPLRRSLFELAVLEAMSAEAAAHDGPLAQSLKDAGKKVAALGDRLRRQWGSRGDAVAGLLGGQWDAKSRAFFQTLAAIDSYDQRARFDTALARTRAALEGMPVKRKSRGGDVPRWLEMLLADVSAKQSQIWTDIEVSLGWILDPGDDGASEALLDSLYRHLEDRQVGLPMDQLRAAFGRADGYADPIAKWLRGRLISDRRAGWLLGLMVALAAMDLANAAHPERDRLGPGGTKLLVFTEYADTQSYLLALATALGRVVGESALKRVQEPLLEHVALVARTLQEQAERIASEGTQTRSFRSPVDAEWIQSWVKRVQAEPAGLRDAISHACATLGWASSAGAGVLDDSGTTEEGVEPEEGEEGDDDETPSPPLSDDPILDAFSPWYQISPDPASADAAPQARSRMLAAFGRPVRTLLSTEVLAEGVNLQECGIVAHYDLPWNPTRLIQRNGRVDRRLDPRFEGREGRLAICEALGIDVALANLYEPPSQIYHFTVLPIEPAFGDSAGEPPAERVRRVLTRKLKSIRVLFGLASWPVVLRAADAQRVLTGELEFETPGFRRRERLFEQWRRLADRGVEVPPDAPGGTLVVHANAAWFDNLRRESAGDNAPSWDEARAAVVHTSPLGRAVHSAVDWQIATKNEVPGGPLVTAITGGLLVDGGVVGWDYRQRRQGTVSRWSFLPVILSLEDGAELMDRPCILAAADEEGRARVPTSPTSFAEDILSVAIDALLDHPTPGEEFALPTAPVPGLSAGESAWLRWYLARPFMKLPDRHADEVLAAPPPSGRWNLWVIRR